MWIIHILHELIINLFNLFLAEEEFEDEEDDEDPVVQSKYIVFSQCLRRLFNDVCIQNNFPKRLTDVKISLCWLNK